MLGGDRSEEHTSELQSPCNVVCRLLLEIKKGRTFMRKTIFAILATTALLSTGMFGTRVEAMTPAPLDVAAPNADLVQQSVFFCVPRGPLQPPLFPHPTFFR